jgi:hypothetical protein
MKSGFSPHWYYANSVRGFLKDAEKDGYLQQRLIDAHNHHQINHRRTKDAGSGEVHSWHYCPLALATVLDRTSLSGDQIVILEAVFQQTRQRIDALLCGSDDKQKDNIMVWELKRWNPSNDFKIGHSPNPNDLNIHLIEKDKPPQLVSHPSVQVERYASRLYNVLKEKHGTPVQERLGSYVYMHNCDKGLPKPWIPILFAPKFKRAPEGIVRYRAPLLTPDRMDTHIVSSITRQIGYGEGSHILQKLSSVLFQRYLDGEEGNRTSQ